MAGVARAPLLAVPLWPTPAKAGIPVIVNLELYYHAELCHAQAACLMFMNSPRVSRLIYTDHSLSARFLPCLQLTIPALLRPFNFGSYVRVKMLNNVFQRVIFIYLSRTYVRTTLFNPVDPIVTIITNTLQSLYFLLSI